MVEIDVIFQHRSHQCHIESYNRRLLLTDPLFTHPKINLVLLQREIGLGALLA